MLSLKKAPKVRERSWASNALSTGCARTIPQIAFGDPPIGPEDSGGTTPEEAAHPDPTGRRVKGRSGERTVRRLLSSYPRAQWPEKI